MYCNILALTKHSINQSTFGTFDAMNILCYNNFLKVNNVLNDSMNKKKTTICVNQSLYAAMHAITNFSHRMYVKAVNNKYHMFFNCPARNILHNTN